MVLEQLHFLGKSKVSKKLTSKKKLNGKLKLKAHNQWRQFLGSTESHTQRSLSMMLLLRHWGNNASNSQCYHEGVKSRSMQSPHPRPSPSFMFTACTSPYPFHQ